MDKNDTQYFHVNCWLSVRLNDITITLSNTSRWKNKQRVFQGIKRRRIFEHFGPSLATSLKDGKVVKVLFEANKEICAIKINFYDTSLKCTLFAELSDTQKQS